MKMLIFLALILLANVHAESCTEAEQQKADGLVDEYPMDDYAVKLAALRTGLCYYVEHGEISKERAGDLFELEREKMIFEKAQQNIKPVT